MYKITPIVLALAAAAFGSVRAEADYRTPAAARAVVEEYYDAIDAADYRAAYQLWSGAGSASGKTYSGFRKGFVQTAHSHVVTAEPVNGDAAMGSLYVEVPVEVFATLKNGRRQHFSGHYTLRRVNDVDGASEAQTHWHLASATLRLKR